MSKLNEILGYTDMWDFLEKNGFLAESAREEDIVRGKKQWRKLYKKAHKQLQRMTTKEVSVVFKNEDELIILKALAEKHHKSLSSFLKEASRAYAEKKYLQVNESVMIEIKQLLELTEIQVRRITENIEDEHLPTYSGYQELLELIMNLEYQLSEVLERPKLIKEAIAELVHEQPWYKKELLKIIESNDYAN